MALFAAVAITAYAVDVVSKILAVEHLTDRPDVELVGDLFVLHLVRNPGAAFSTGTAYTEVLTCVAIAAVVVILYLARRLGSLGWAVALGLLLAGVAGNLTDRMLREPGPLRGHVIDFFMLPHWPVFNVADICINAAAVLILIQVFRGIRLDGTRTAEATPRTPTRRQRSDARADHRVLTVPEGLAGERVDAAMARLFGLSRTRAADLIAQGHVAARRRRRRQERPGAARRDPRRDASRSRPTRSRSSRRSSRGSRSSTTTTRSW